MITLVYYWQFIFDSIKIDLWIGKYYMFIFDSITTEVGHIDTNIKKICFYC